MEHSVVNTYPDLFWAYTAVWGVLAVYLWRLVSRISRIEAAFKAGKEGGGCCNGKESAAGRQ